jgi:hypothetical protein
MDNIKFLLVLPATEVHQLILCSGRITLGLYIIPLGTENYCLYIIIIIIYCNWVFTRLQ